MSVLDSGKQEITPLPSKSSGNGQVDFKMNNPKKQSTSAITGSDYQVVPLPGDGQGNKRGYLPKAENPAMDEGRKTVSFGKGSDYKSF